MLKAIQFSAYVLALLLGSGCDNAQGQKMSEIKFDLGRNITETARASGVQRFAVSDTAGLVDYSVNNIPADVSVHYNRPGYEIKWAPVFAFTMYADRDHGPALNVEMVQLILHIREMNDEQAHAFVEQTIAQFQKGRWKRYANPEWDVLLTGRSSLLNEAGELDSMANTIDPNYKISMSDWLVLTRNGAEWRWVGDGILATLSVDNSPGQDKKPAYRMNMSFENLDAKLKLDAKNQAERNAEGDAKGWNSTAEYETNKKDRAAQIKRLVANAIKRGDSVVEP
jgi:hypothetical protein